MTFDGSVRKPGLTGLVCTKEQYLSKTTRMYSMVQVWKWMCADSGAWACRERLASCLLIQSRRAAPTSRGNAFLSDWGDWASAVMNPILQPSSTQPQSYSSSLWNCCNIRPSVKTQPDWALLWEMTGQQETDGNDSEWLGFASSSKNAWQNYEAVSEVFFFFNFTSPSWAQQTLQLAFSSAVISCFLLHSRATSQS